MRFGELAHGIPKASIGIIRWFNRVSIGPRIIAKNILHCGYHGASDFTSTGHNDVDMRRKKPIKQTYNQTIHTTKLFFPTFPKSISQTPIPCPGRTQSQPPPSPYRIYEQYQCSQPFSFLLTRSRDLAHLFNSNHSHLTMRRLRQKVYAQITIRTFLLLYIFSPSSLIHATSAVI